jgi:hypothetical protein
VHAHGRTGISVYVDRLGVAHDDGKARHFGHACAAHSRSRTLDPAQVAGQSCSSLSTPSRPGQRPLTGIATALPSEVNGRAIGCGMLFARKKKGA